MIYEHGWRLLAVLCLVCMGATQSAWAQSDQERAGARVAARQGIDAYQAGKYEEALRLLERAQSLVDAPTHLLFIARSRAKLGLLVEAREAYQKIITTNLADSAPAAFLEAQRVAPGELSALEARLAKLEVNVVGVDGRELSNVVVQVGGVRIPPALLGLAVPANPGRLEVTATADGMAISTKTILLSEGGSETITFELEPGSETKGSGKEVTPDESPVSSSPSNTRRTAGWVTASAGAAVGVTGGVFGFLSMNQLSKAKSDEDLCGSEKLCTPDGRDEINSARTKALVADISMGVGIAALGIGTYLILTSPSKSTTVGVRSISPSADRHGGYLLLQGGF